jgi:hypothetical protein
MGAFCGKAEGPGGGSMDGIEDTGLASEAPEDGDILNSASDFPATLDYVNLIRARHNADPLAFDDEAADHAKSCVQAGMDSGNMTHCYGLNNDGIDDGQCISWGTVGYWDMKIGVDKWMEEESEYSAEFTACHYTQIIWKASTGVGIAMGQSGGSYYICMNFTPPGNQYNQYADNVDADTGDSGGYNPGNNDDNDATGDGDGDNDGYTFCDSSNGPYYWKACDGYDAYKDGYYWYPQDQTPADAQWYSYS